MAKTHEVIQLDLDGLTPAEVIAEMEKYTDRKRATIDVDLEYPAYHPEETPWPSITIRIPLGD